MPGVAQAKWNRKLPIIDADREAKSLAKLVAEGTAAGIGEDVVREFFQAQFTASKLIQQQLFAQWQREQQPPFSAAPDLDQTIRPQIDKINQQLLTGLRTLSDKQSMTSEEFQRTRDHVFGMTSWTKDVIEAALQPLQRLAK